MGLGISGAKNSIGNQPHEANHRSDAVKNRAKPTRIANRVANDSQALVKVDGVTGAIGPTLFEKIHRQYKSQENNLVPE